MVRSCEASRFQNDPSVASGDSDGCPFTGYREDITLKARANRPRHDLL
jgi:hypothetical protein